MARAAGGKPRPTAAKEAWDAREDAAWFAEHEVREEPLRVIPCDSGGMPLEGPDGAARESVPPVPASWRSTGPAWQPPGGAVRVSTRVLPGGRVEVVAAGLREGAAVDVYVVAAEGTVAVPRRRD